jgi:hypothetical protein
MCLTPFGIGRIHEVRKDGFRVVKLPFGMAYIQKKDIVAVPKPDSDENIISAWEDANERALYGVELFFSNKFQEAEHFLRAEKDVYPVYALGHACLTFLKAIMTWEKKDLETAQELLKEARIMAEKYAPQEGLVSSVVSGTVGVAGAGARKISR